MAALAARKRVREEDNCDFMPLSKRINNLHIDNVTTMIVNNQQQLQHDQISLRETFREDVRHESSGPPPYNPGITSAQSSYYFDNKLLYELYLERLQRSGQQPHY